MKMHCTFTLACAIIATFIIVTTVPLVRKITEKDDTGMFVLPVIFLCNTVLFVALLEERFKLLATTSIAAVAFIASMLVNLFIEGFLADPVVAGQMGNAICVLILFLMSIFTSSNNLAQKLFVGLLLLTNYQLVTGFVPQLLGLLPFGTGGIAAVLIANGIFIIFALLTAAIFARPLHYFFRRGISPSMVGLCLLQLLCWFVAKGGANDYFALDFYALTFSLTVFLYSIVVFCLLSIYGGAKHKVQDILASTDQKVMDVAADSFNTMLVNVNTYKTLKRNLDHQMDRLGALAQAGRVTDILDYANQSKQSTVLMPLAMDYCENPYLSAVIATKTAYAKSHTVTLESNISLGDTPVRLAEVCTVVNDLLSTAIAQAEQSPEQERFVRLNVMPTEGHLSIECVHSQSQASRDRANPLGGTLYSFLDDFLAPKSETDGDNLRGIMRIVELRNGKINVSHSQGTVITRIALND